MEIDIDIKIKNKIIQNQEMFTDCNELIQEIVDNILFYYHPSPKMDVNPITQLETIRTIQSSGIDVHQIRVHKQHVGNLCGFHASFNIISVIQSLKYGIPVEVMNCTAFWSFVQKTQSFLRSYALYSGQDTGFWPWREEDIQIGDFERTHWKACLYNMPIFKQAFKSEQCENINYDIVISTVYFQFGLIINSAQDMNQLEESIEKFSNFKANKNNHMIFAAMLGITNHWVSVVAMKNVEGIKLFLFDSGEKDVLTMNHEEMVEYLDQYNIQRVINKKPPLEPFTYKYSLQALKDLKSCVLLIAEWLSGSSTVQEYSDNSQAEYFLMRLLKQLKQKQEEFVASDTRQFITQDTYNNVLYWSKEMMHDIQDYAKKGIFKLNKQNQILLRTTIDFLGHILQLNQEESQKINAVLNNLIKITESIQ